MNGFLLCCLKQTFMDVTDCFFELKMDLIQHGHSNLAWLLTFASLFLYHYIKNYPLDRSEVYSISLDSP